MSEVIRAAGAVLWRRLSDELIQVALIHRPKYDDWSFPKGKVEAGELEISCAYREVLEETGYESKFGPQLGQVMYKVDGMDKEVSYWAAEAIGNPIPIMDLNEVDQLVWFTISDAYAKLSLNSDKEILTNFENFGHDSSPLILLRHAQAISREEWNSDDGDRPLAHEGQLQAKRFLVNFMPYGVNEIITSDAVRCYESVEHISRALNLNSIFSPQLSEYEFYKDKKGWQSVIDEVLENDFTTLVCSHNPVIPTIVKKLIGKKSLKRLDHDLLPGEAWVIHHRDGEVIAIDWVPAPNI